jgi:hypothetical protein
MSAFHKCPKTNLSGLTAANVVQETTTKINAIAKNKHLNFFNIVLHLHSSNNFFHQSHLHDCNEPTSPPLIPLPSLSVKISAEHPFSAKSHHTNRLFTLSHHDKVSFARLNDQLHSRLNSDNLGGFHIRPYQAVLIRHQSKTSILEILFQLSLQLCQLRFGQIKQRFAHMPDINTPHF